MRSTFTSALLFTTAILLCGKLSAQDLTEQHTDTTSTTTADYVRPFSGPKAFRSWSIGINAGIMSTFNVFSSNSKLDFTLPNIQYGYGGYIKKQILPSLGIQADVMLGKVNGDNAQPDAAGISPYKSFSTEIHYAVSLSSNITLANINWQFMNGSIQPYFTSGIGTMNYTPTVTTSAGDVKNFSSASSSGAINEIFVPVGVGLKFNVSRNVNLELAYNVNFVYSDNLDGYHYGYNNDKFSYVHIGLEFALGGHSKPQLASHNPVASMRQEYMSEIQMAKINYQVQLDSEKAKNREFANMIARENVTISKLTTDSDGDGVADFFDKCPGTPANTKVDGSGCPLPVAARPEEKVYITEQDRVVVNEAVQDLEFNTGSATISTVSYPSLEKLAKLLADKKLHLKLAGYTDNTGSAALNLRLSKDRAEAVKMFLVSRGADASLIQTDGYGKANPIASNKTKAGRKLNRRVEFSLF
jgi:OmpA-OmpF porin, OOP family